jgi:hypothetical protein
MIALPTFELIEEECRKFDEDNALVEETVRRLFTLFPKNTEPSEVLSKVVVLNQLYSTRVLTIHLQPLATHIVACEVDPLIDNGSVAVVEKIYDCRKRTTTTPSRPTIAVGAGPTFIRYGTATSIKLFGSIRRTTRFTTFDASTYGLMASSLTL